MLDAVFDALGPGVSENCADVIRFQLFAASKRRAWYPKTQPTGYRSQFSRAPSFGSLAIGSLRRCPKSASRSATLRSAVS